MGDGDAMTYAINEIFYSIQGEGVRAGTANVFVRFQSCNLRCSQDAKVYRGDVYTAGFDCDTEFETGTQFDLGRLVQLMNAAMPGTRSCILTGGEPAVQVDDDLVKALKADGWFVAIETNGTIEIATRLHWVCVSPKTALHTIRQKHCDELKMVRHEGQALPKEETLKSHGIHAGYKLVSPAFSASRDETMANLRWCIQLVKDNPEWRLSVQQHKLWGIR